MDRTLNNQDALSLDLLKQQDRAEFSRLVDQFSGPLYNVALRILGDPQDAEDVLQETLIKAYQSIDKFEGRSSISTWLYRIATNEALMLIRRHKPDTFEVDAQGQDDADDAEPFQIVDWCCLPEREFVNEEARRFLDAAVQKLSPALRVVFVLRDIQGLSIRETAETLELTEMTVKTRLLRARLRMRSELTSYFGDRLMGTDSHER